MLYSKLGLSLLVSTLILLSILSSFGQRIPIQSHAIATTTVSILQGAELPDNEKFYGPQEITVNPGDMIVWENKDTAIHTATSGSGEEATPDGKFDSGLIMSGKSSQPIAMPNEPGQYPYFCTLHPWMTGIVTVYS